MHYIVSCMILHECVPNSTSCSKIFTFAIFRYSQIPSHFTAPRNLTAQCHPSRPPRQHPSSAQINAVMLTALSDSDLAKECQGCQGANRNWPNPRLSKCDSIAAWMIWGLAWVFNHNSTICQQLRPATTEISPAPQSHTKPAPSACSGFRFSHSWCTNWSSAGEQLHLNHLNNPKSPLRVL